MFDDHDPERSEREPEPRKDRSDKIPALIAAAKKARDDGTALLLLQKAKQIDPKRIEVYLLRADIYERRGDDQRELLEYKEALEADPTSWIVRFRILNLEYPRSRNLKHAAGIIRDLAWQKGLPERLFNASRGEFRSESELGHDEALVGHMGLAGKPGHGMVSLNAVAAAPDGCAYVLNAYEPWLERFTPDGTLIYGIDLWLTDDEDLAQQPSDVAGTAGGIALVAEPRAGRVLRFDPGGKHLGILGKGPLAEPVAVAVAGDGPALVLCAGDASLRRLDPMTGRAAGRAALVAGVAALRWGGVAAAPDGTAYVLAGDELIVVAPGGKAEAGRIPLPRGARRPAAGRLKGPRRGIAFDPSDGTVLVADAGRSAVFRIDAAGRAVEKIGGPGSLRGPRDVAVDAAGTITVADHGNARVVQRRKGDPPAEWRCLIGCERWSTPADAKT